MKILLNTTKTMDVSAARPGGLRGTRPRLLDDANLLMSGLRDLDRADLAEVMDLSPALAATVGADLAVWGAPRRPRQAAVFAFTGLVFKHLDARRLPASAVRDAQVRLRILSGLYGVLRPLDLLEAYRLEMGCRFVPPGARNLTAFWKPRLTAAVSADLAAGEPLLNLASQEYFRALDERALPGPVISPVFKERRDDGSLKVVTVHAKEARGRMARYVLSGRIDDPAGLAGFADHGWEPAGPPPDGGPWVFTRV